MTMRLIKTLPNGTKVYRNAEWDEYVVKPRGTNGDDATWYFTGDKEDAMNTAQHIDDDDDDELAETIQVTLSVDVTLDQAIAWDFSTEKFTFCLDLLRLSLAIDGDNYCTFMVEKLEDKFDHILKLSDNAPFIEL